MATEVFPEVIGVSWDVHLKPQFSTKVATHTSGKETRTAYWENPIYDIELTYDYLPDKRELGTTDLQKILGFFLQRQGSFEEFLYKMKDFNRVTNYLLLTGDGLTPEIELTDKIDQYVQPIGQVKEDSLAMRISLAPQAVIAGVGGVTLLPYPDLVTITEVKKGATVYVPVMRTPVGNQYSFDVGTGTIQFPTGEAGNSFNITYSAALLETTGYTILQPNVVVFVTAPPVNSTVTASYDYYFIVRFADDQQDFDTFADKFWELQQLNLRSVIV